MRIERTHKSLEVRFTITFCHKRIKNKYIGGIVRFDAPHKKRIYREEFRIIKFEPPGDTAIMRKHKMSKRTPNFSLDTFSGKRGRGRPPTINPSFVRGCADGHRIWLERNWGELEALLLVARTEQEVTNAFRSGGSGFENFFPLVRVILMVLRDPKFPKHKKAQ